MNRPTRNPSAAVWSLIMVMLCASCGCRKDPPQRGPDFSTSNSVSIVLGSTDSEYGGGIQHLYHEKDGVTATEILGDIPCRHLDVKEFEIGYVYFQIDPSFKKRRAGDVDITIEYYDQGTGTLALQFDATGSKKVPNAAYADAASAVSLFDSKTWKTATFRVRNAAFKNSQNSGSDFRLVVQPPELCLRKVTVTRAK